MSTPGAIVLSGGRARRYGGSAKPAAEVGGRSLLRRVVDALGDVPIVVVGPATGLDIAALPRIIETREDPPYSGPLAATAAGLDALPVNIDEVVLLAADLPFLTVDAVRQLRDALSAAPAAVLVSGSRRHWLAAAWRRDNLVAAVRRQKTLENAPMWTIYDDLTVAEVDCGERVAFDVDTPEDLQRAKEWT